MTFDAPEEKRLFENIVEKGENAGNQHFLRFPQGFLSYQRGVKPFQAQNQKENCLRMLSVWTRLQILSSCNPFPNDIF